MCVKLNKLLA